MADLRDIWDGTADMEGMGPSPDTFMETKPPDLFRLALKCHARELKWLDMARREMVGAAEGLASERRLRDAYEVVLRIRAHEMAGWIEGRFGVETLPCDLQDDGCSYCWSIALLHALRVHG